MGVFDPSTNITSLVDISAFYTGGDKYWGCVVTHNGTVVFVPVNANRVGVLDAGNSAPAYTVSGGVPQASYTPSP